MRVKTWLQRLTDESSHWFNAVKAEDDGDLVTAVSCYLKDAKKSARDKSIVRVALSCSCAATCLVKRGNLVRARQLYSRAAKLYSLYANLVMSSSIREATWSLREAHDNYLLGGEPDMAQVVRNEYLGLTSRINPFSQVHEIEPMFDFARERSATLQTPAREAKLPSDLEALIDTFLKDQSSLHVGRTPVEFSKLDVVNSIDLSGVSSIDEKSIVS